LRGAESDADAEFVRELAEKFGLRFFLGEADVAAAAVGDNLEATARRLRYEWLASTGASWVATGHTADDQAETVLHRLIRGTGIQGLRGIAVSRELVSREAQPSADPIPGDAPSSGGGSALGCASRLTVVRPLLTVTRLEIMAYLADLNQPYREDSSNADLTFTRNRIRHELLPLLKTFNPEIVTVLNRVASQSADAFRVLTQLAETLRETAERPLAGDTLVFATEPLASADPYLLRELFRLVWQREGWSANGMTAAHWDRVVAVVLGELLACDFPAGIHVRRAGNVVQLRRRA
jgi:tRNA(Ile)-lysidine synthase